MNLRVFNWYSLDHPFHRGEEVLFCNRDSFLKKAAQIAERQDREDCASPRILRVHISSREQGGPKDDEAIRSRETAFRKREEVRFNKAKAVEAVRFSQGLLIGYLLYLAPDSFWAPIETVVSMIAHGLSDYARWCVIAIFPVKAFLRTFGTLFRLKGKIRLGIPGTWQRIDERAEVLKIFRDFEESPAGEIDREIDEYLKNLETKVRNEKDRVIYLRIAEALNDDLWKKGEREFPDKLLRNLISEGEMGDLWGEMVRLDSLRSELLFRTRAGIGKKAPLLHFTPRMTAPTYPLPEGTDFRFRTYAAQADNLSAFNSLPSVRKLKDQVVDGAARLKKAGTNQERIALLDRMCRCFQGLRDEMWRFHMGENLLVPRERSNDPALFYHRLYDLTGKTLCELEKGYRRTAWGIVPLKSSAAGKRHIRRFFDSADLFLNGHCRGKRAALVEKLSTAGGKSTARGLLLASAIVFLIGSLFSFYRTEPGDRIILSTMRLGYHGRFINRETAILNPTETRIGWHLPRPLSSHTTIDQKARNITVYMIMGEHRSGNPVGQALTWLSGQLGTQFDIIELNMEFRPKDAALWSRYDGDGKGERRLLRDLSELSEEWRDNRGSELTALSSAEFDRYFHELSDRGMLKEYLKRVFSQTAFSTNIYYGSLSERYGAGIDAVLREFSRVAGETDLTAASQIVSDLKKEIGEQVKVEYSLLRSDPELLNRLVADPYGNAQKLRNLETVWLSISNYVRYQYRQNELINMLSGGFIDLSLKEEALRLYPLQLDLTEYLQSNGLMGKLIDIRSVRFRHKVIGLTEFTQYQEKWKETI